MTAESWELLLWLGIGTGLYWAWHVWRWRRIGCSKCDGKGSFMARSLVLQHPVQRPCPRCQGKPWRKRVGSPNPDKKG